MIGSPNFEPHVFALFPAKRYHLALRVHPPARHLLICNLPSLPFPAFVLVIRKLAVEVQYFLVTIRRAIQLHSSSVFRILMPEENDEYMPSSV